MGHPMLPCGVCVAALTIGICVPSVISGARQDVTFLELATTIERTRTLSPKAGDVIAHPLIVARYRIAGNPNDQANNARRRVAFGRPANAA